METLTTAEIDVTKIIALDNQETSKKLLEAIQIIHDTLRFPNDKFNNARAQKLLSKFVS